jgi:hypothetical protein
MSYNSAAIKEAMVLKSNPATHTATVEIATPAASGPIECAILMLHGSGTNEAHMISMPSVGQKVLVLLDSSEDSGVILGTLPKDSLGSEPTITTTQFDPLQTKQRDSNYRGEDFADIYPGDLSLRSGGSRVLLSDSEVLMSSGDSRIEMSGTVGGFSHLHTQSDTLSHSNSLLSMRVVDSGDDSNAYLELAAFTQDTGAQSSLGDFSGINEADTTIRMNSSTPLDVNYSGKAAITIDATGHLLLKGRAVTIETDGEVHNFGSASAPDTVYDAPVVLGSKQDTTVSSGGTLLLSGNTTEISANNAVSLSSTNGTLGITAGGTSKSVPLPGLDTTLSIQAPNGGISLSAGSYFPGPGSLTKPGVRIQSDTGGDVHLVSASTPGGLFTTGSIVLDSSTPASAAVSGGLGNYGIVLNSPTVCVGGLPGVSDTPAGVPGPFGAPVPPVYDSYVKHFSFSTIYSTALLSGITAGLAAAFPPTASASATVFAGAFSSAMASMASPPVGRPVGIVGVG